MQRWRDSDCSMGCGRDCKCHTFFCHLYVQLLNTCYIPHDQDFYYPENVAFPVGGPGNSQFIMLEMHYDNPQLVSGDDNVAVHDNCMQLLSLLLHGSNIDTPFHSTYPGVADSSGMEFSYTNTPSQHRAGFLSIAHAVRKDMVIPPNAENYTISSICTGSCTQAVSNGSQSPVFMHMKSEWSTYKSCMCLLACFLTADVPTRRNYCLW